MENQQNVASTRVATEAERQAKAFNAVAISVDKALEKTVSDFEKKVQAGATAVLTLSDQLEQLVHDTQVQEQRLSEVQKNADAKVREAAAETAIRIRENAQEVLEELMSDRKLAYIAQSDLYKLQDQLEEAVADNEQAIKTAVATATSRIEKDALHAKALLVAEHEKEMQEHIHTIASLRAQMSTLTQANVNLHAELREEREARVKIAEAAGKQNITVNSAK